MSTWTYNLPEERMLSSLLAYLSTERNPVMRNRYLLPANSTLSFPTKSDVSGFARLMAAERLSKPASSESGRSSAPLLVLGLLDRSLRAMVRRGFHQNEICGGAAPPVDGASDAGCDRPRY
jgi:hypothetical protein